MKTERYERQNMERQNGHVAEDDPIRWSPFMMMNRPHVGDIDSIDYWDKANDRCVAEEKQG